MGRDKALSDNYPSVVINGRVYQYGKDPDESQYLVENARYAKDYWVFNEKGDLEAFLINLPDSADRDRRLELHPDWHEATREQRHAYIKEDLAALRDAAAKKVTDGTARNFNMDLEGEHGPYEPQRIDVRSDEPALERVERQLHEYKVSLVPPELRSMVSGELSFGLPQLLVEISWDSTLTEAGKLRVLEAEVDWTGVSDSEKEVVLAREVDFSKITADQLDFVYEDIADDLEEEVDASVARRLFDRAAAETQVRDTTRDLVESIRLDMWPRPGAIVDFGLKTQEHYEALYYPIREGDITPQQLDAALGSGAALTELARSAKSNPHRDIEFKTDWDGLRPEPEDEQFAAVATSPSPSEIAETEVGVESPAIDPGRDRGNGR